MPTGVYPRKKKSAARTVLIATAVKKAARKKAKTRAMSRIRMLAEKGAHVRLKELAAERNALMKMFPGISE